MNATEKVYEKQLDKNLKELLKLLETVKGTTAEKAVQEAYDRLWQLKYHFN